MIEGILGMVGLRFIKLMKMMLLTLCYRFEIMEGNFLKDYMSDLGWLDYDDKNEIFSKK